VTVSIALAPVFWNEYYSLQRVQQSIETVGG